MHSLLIRPTGWYYFGPREQGLMVWHPRTLRSISLITGIVAAEAPHVDVLRPGLDSLARVHCVRLAHRHHPRVDPDAPQYRTPERKR